MKTTKRLAALAAAATMTACMAIPMVAMNVSAVATTGIDEGNNTTTTTTAITITEKADITSSALKAFKIFDGQVVTDGTGEEATKTFVATDWASGVNVSALRSALLAEGSALKDKFASIANETDWKSDGIALKVANILSKLTSADDAIAFAKIAANCVDSEEGISGTNNKDSEGKYVTSVTFSGLDYGYYIVIDTEAAKNASNYSAYTLGMLRVVDGTTQTQTVTVKRDFPTFDKQIGDINDTTDTDETYTYNEAADHDIGDDVPFKLIATMPSNIDKYDSYMLKFYDDLQAEVFTLNADSFKVTYQDSDNSGVDVTDFFTKSIDSDTNDLGKDTNKFSDATGGDVDFTLECSNIKGIEGLTVTKDGWFEVYYTAELTDKANLGATGNWNGAYLEYSNNPNWDGIGTEDTGTSPVDYVVAFTYQAIVNKIDAVSKNPLGGAEFTLYKKIYGTDVEKEITVFKKNTEGTTFEFKGLDDGTYVLRETTVPGGYIGMADFEFTIEATERQDDGLEALTGLTCNDDAVAVGKVFTLSEDDKTYGTTDNSPLGSVSLTVENKQGVTLPTTGGIGTTIFYVVGSLMVGVAGVYLIAKKRMNNSEQ